MDVESGNGHFVVLNYFSQKLHWSLSHIFIGSDSFIGIGSNIMLYHKICELWRDNSQLMRGPRFETSSVYRRDREGFNDNRYKNVRIQGGSC